jgi:hypothetical protein
MALPDSNELKEMLAALQNLKGSGSASDSKPSGRPPNPDQSSARTPGPDIDKKPDTTVSDDDRETPGVQTPQFSPEFMDDWIKRYDYDTYYKKLMQLIQDEGIPFTNPNRRLQHLTADEAANGKDYRETLALSRMADALNNRWYRTPQRVAVAYAGSGGGPSRYSVPEWRQPYQLRGETEEMRQQARIRGYEQATTTAEIERQQAAKNLSVKFKEYQELEKLRRLGQLDEIGMSRLQQLYNEIFFQDVEDPYRMRRSRMDFYVQQLITNINIPELKTRQLWRWYEENPDFANTLAGIQGMMAGLPDQWSHAYQQEVSKIMREANERGDFTTATRKIADLNTKTIHDMLAAYGTNIPPELQTLYEHMTGNKADVTG